MNTAAIKKLASKKKLYLIQVFRGFAALLVVLAHGSLIFHENLNRGFLFDIFYISGGSGVDFFFVLSGFIIFYVHRKDIGNPTKLRNFLLKRFMRIYPIYWVVLTGKLLTSVNLSNSDPHHQVAWIEFVKAYLLFPQDRVLLSSTFIGVSWTLSFEIFFYLIFCLLICFKPKFYLPIIGVLLSGVFLNFLNLIHAPDDNIILQFLLSPLHIEFLLGVLAAYIIYKYRISYGIQLLYAGFFLYTLSTILNTHHNFLPRYHVIAYGIPSTILVIGAVALEMSKSVTIPQILILLGDASYSIYLIHGFVINNITKVALKFKIIDLISQNTLTFSLFAILNVVIAVIVGCFMYLYIEKQIISIMKPTITKE